MSAICLVTWVMFTNSYGLSQLVVESGSLINHITSLTSLLTTIINHNILTIIIDLAAKYQSFNNNHKPYGCFSSIIVGDYPPINPYY